MRRACQRALDYIAGYHSWPFYLDFGWITTVDDITAGDADVTKESTAVSSDNGSTSWPVGVADKSSRKRKFRLQDDSPFYTIASRVSSTSIVLDQPYQGSTATDQKYRIYQDEYRLFGDADVQQTFTQIEESILMLSVNAIDFDQVFPTPSSHGNPIYAIPIGRRQDVYDTGTIAASSTTKVITGSSTLWLSVQGLSRGNRIRIANEVYTIQSVDSDTQITVYETISVSASAGASYQIFMDNMVVQVADIPDSVQNLHYRYYRKPVPLVNDYDEPDLPPAFHRLLIVGALMEAYAQRGKDEASAGAESSLLRGLDKMKVHYTTNQLYERKSSIIGRQRRLRLRYPLSFDVSHSS